MLSTLGRCVAFDAPDTQRYRAAPYWPAASIPSSPETDLEKFAGQLSIQIRHNPVVGRSPSFVGEVVIENRHTTFLRMTKVDFTGFR
jgi:hypothetical protein